MAANSGATSCMTIAAVASLAKSRDKVAVANQDQPAAAGRDFLHVRDRFFEHPIIGGNDEHRHVLVDQRDRPMF